MIVDLLRKIYHLFRPVKRYTLEEWSQKIVEELRASGASIGENVDIIDSQIDIIGGGNLLNIGNNVTITNARILTHDASTKKFLGKTKIGRVVIGNDVFIGADSVILPDTVIGDRVVIGAGCVVAKDIPDNSVVIGNPCKIICSLDDYLLKEKQKLNLSETGEIANPGFII